MAGKTTQALSPLAVSYSACAVARASRHLRRVASDLKMSAQLKRIADGRWHVESATTVPSTLDDHTAGKLADELDAKVSAFAPVFLKLQFPMQTERACKQVRQGCLR